jgi:hypothetical protein
LSQQKKPVFSFPFKGNIWKLRIDAFANILVPEIRDGENRETGFAGIDLTTKKILWQGPDINEKWWIGLEEAKYGKVILHGYKDIQNPEHKGLIVLDSRSGKVLWKKEELSFYSTTHEAIIAYDMEETERRYKKIDINEGKIIEEISESELTDERKSEESFVKNSSHYRADNKYFEKIAGFAEAYIGKKPEQALDYLEYKEGIIVSFYAREEEKLVNYLMVVNEKGELIYNEPIDKDLKGVGIDTFFLYNDLLIFIKNKKELVIFEL